MGNYYRDEPNSGAEGNNNYSSKNSKSFDYKTNFVGKLVDDDEELEDIKIAVPVQYFSKFFRFLCIPLINCEVSLNLKWSKKCVLTLQATREADPDADPEVIGINNPTNAKFEITNCKLYVPVVTLPIKNENRLYEMLKKGFSVNIYWRRYRCQITNQTTGLINYLIDATFDKVSRLFVLAFENEDDRTLFSKYCTPTVEIKEYNVLIDQEPFFELSVRNKKETYERILSMCKDLDDYTTGSLLDYDYFLNRYKFIVIDLSKQDIKRTKQQIKFIGELSQNATTFFIIENTEKTTLNFSQNFVDFV